jgi:uncharacterized iron-regulated protein
MAVKYAAILPKLHAPRRHFRKPVDSGDLPGDARSVMPTRVWAILSILAVAAPAVLVGCAGQPPTVAKTVRPEPTAAPPAHARRSTPTSAWSGRGYTAPPKYAPPKFLAVDAASIEGAGARNPRQLPMFDGYTAQSINWDDLMRRVSAADVIILGEQHDDAMGHALQLAVVQDTAERWPSQGVLTLEMLERDEQFIVDDYLEGLIDAKTFAELTDSTKWAGEGSWTNWYQPIIDAAALHGWGVIAANAPRRYVRISRTDGYERLKGLPAERQNFVSIPVTWPMDYRQRFVDIMNSAGDDEEEDEDEGEDKGDEADTALTPATAPAQSALPAAQTSPDLPAPQSPPSPAAESAIEAPASRPASPHGPIRPEDIDSSFRSQLLWDGTMGDSIARALRTPRTRKVVHLVGQFHSDFSGGTVKEVRARRPIARVLTVSMQRADGAHLRERDEGRADVVIYTGRRPPKKTADSQPAAE